MKRYFHRYRDDRFALTTLQNPNCEVRTYAQLVQAAQPNVAQPLLPALSVREGSVQGAAQIAATQPLAAPDVPDPIPAAQFISNRNNPDSEIWQTNENKRETIF